MSNMTKIKTMKLQGNDYAKVIERVKAFRSENPRGDIDTKPTITEDGKIIFKATIIKNKSDEFSATATGHSMGENKGQKSFEKLETIAVGRALALLGYAGDGEIASSEEMEEFEEYKTEKHFEKLEEYTELLESSKSLEELKANWATIDGNFRKELENIKNRVKEQYESKEISK